MPRRLARSRSGQRKGRHAERAGEVVETGQQRRHADELHVPGDVQAARDHPVEPAPREPRRIGTNAVHGIDDVLGQRVRPVVLPRRCARREAHLALSTERAASGSARLRRDRDPLLPRPPRPRRAQVVEEEAVCRHEVLADRDWRAPVVELVRVSLPRLASAIYRTAGAEKAGRRPRRDTPVLPRCKTQPCSAREPIARLPPANPRPARVSRSPLATRHDRASRRCKVRSPPGTPPTTRKKHLRLEKFFRKPIDAFAAADI